MDKLIHSSVFWVIVIFLASSIFRVFFLDLIEFKADEAMTVYQTAQFFDHPYLIQRGLISGIGLYNFPLFNYLMILLALPSRDPQFLSLSIAFVNTVLVVVFYLLIRRYYNNFTAVLSSLLLAFSPWGIIFSRKIWAQDLIFLLFIPLLWLLHELILRKNGKVTLPFFVILMLLVQLHGSGVFLLAATALIFLILRVPIRFKEAVMGVLIGLIPAIPYILFQINFACPDCEAFMKYQQSAHIFDQNNFIRPFQILSGMGYHFILGKDYSVFVSTFPFLDKIKYVFFAGFIGPFLGTVVIVLRKKGYIFLPLYFILIPTFYFFTRTVAFMHYFVIIFPFSILLTTSAMSFTFYFTNHKLIKTLSIVALALFVTSNIIFVGSFYHYLANKKSIDGDYGPIFSITKAFVDKETKEYNNLFYYPQLKNYAYIYAGSKDIHNKLGEFFLEKGEQELAEKEFEKAQNSHQML